MHAINKAYTLIDTNTIITNGYIDAKLDIDLSDSVFEIEIAKKKYKKETLTKELCFNNEFAKI